MAQPTHTATRPAPVSSHRLFPVMVTAWFSALFGLGTLAVHPALLQAALIRGQIDRPIMAIAMRIDWPAPALVALAMAALGGIIGAGVARGISKSAAPHVAHHPAPAPREVEIISIRSLDLHTRAAPLDHRPAPTPGMTERASPAPAAPDPLPAEPAAVAATPTPPVRARQVFGMAAEEEILSPLAADSGQPWADPLAPTECETDGPSAALTPMVIFPGEIVQHANVMTPHDAPTRLAPSHAPDHTTGHAPSHAPIAPTDPNETGHSLRTALANLQRVNGLA